MTVHFLNSNPGFNTDAVIEIAADESKVAKPTFLKNVRSTVHLGSGEAVGDDGAGGGTDSTNKKKKPSFSFRNPVSFFNKTERTTRDAEHETDAVINFYFIYPNTPRYIKAVATAFKTGSFETKPAAAADGVGRRTHYDRRGRAPRP